VEPGTRFELEKMPCHFTMTAKAKVLSVIGHHRHQDETYFDYRKSAEP